MVYHLKRGERMRQARNFLFMAAAAVFLAAGCQAKQQDTPQASPQATSETASEAASPAAPAKDTLVYAIDSDPSGEINPVTTGDRYGLMAEKLIYSPLYMYNGESNIAYFLAESVTAEQEGLVYTAKLRSGVKWTDGQPFTADDVVFTYEACENPDNGSESYDLLVNADGAVAIEKVDGQTIRFTFPAPNSSPMENLGSIFIMPKHIYEGVADFANSEKNELFVGTGPYKMAEFRPGSHMKFEANPDYFLGAPKIPNIIFRVIPDPNTMLLALQSGEIDAQAIMPTDVAKVKDNPAISLYPYSENRVGYLAFNVRSEKCQNKELRQALVYSLNKKDIMEVNYVSDEYSYIADSFLPRAATFYTSDLPDLSQNLDKAKELAAKNNAADITFVLAYPTSNKAMEPQAIVIQQDAKAAGINIELRPMEAAAFNEQLYTNMNPDFDLYMGGYIMTYDPNGYASLFVSDGAANYMGYNNARVDELFAQGGVEKDQAKRRAIYEELQQVIVDDAAFVPLTENKRILAMNSNVGGVEEASLIPIFNFEDMSKLYFKS